jgi:hypothetical protein
MGRPGVKTHIDLSELEKLAMLQCTDEEIAAWFGVTTRTIERRRKSPHFAAVMERGKAKGRISVRRQQMKLLEAGNATMGVWLGKQLLQQTDHLYHDVNGPAIQIVCPAGSPVQAPLDVSVGITTIDIARPAGYLEESKVCHLSTSDAKKME